MKFGRYPHHEFTAVSFPGSWRWKLLAIALDHFDPLFRNLAKFTVDVGFAKSVSAAVKESGAVADKTTVFLGPAKGVGLQKGSNAKGKDSRVLG